MKFGVIQFPGSNCDDDMVYVLGTVMGRETVKLWHKDETLEGFGPGDCIIVPGGFSYGDYVRAGAIARFSPIMAAVADFAQRGGYVFGICNGFQILCEAGLLPGALLRNRDQRFIARNCYLSTATTATAVTSQLAEGQVLRLPIAHAEGRYYADAATLDELEAQDQILFYYCDGSGELSEAANLNGSTRHIAGICNAKRNVFGMMPHPERASEPLLGNTDGHAIFAGLIEYVEAAATV
ncbi:phosphoribosylformylglycinamidine synthase subunit PurQ [Neolewinella lacunae]|uniref:Phosphoribosylformylglycinamidine synthase subunit PurQ n=1 Tax=Neolewinella lacunae TaxID=1517758 RepID=A0A923TEX0_9BACT|nr:phosphoribosylformylglycinamidine synthase subunit PurQ [Neolewinella lacunae]MBC6996372.1 phosphoribosylformylglycinamidine synthase subunit PurQ [Neolewinella lacunae]MDN3636995.1 phosphoribosylformylglycinamidine synthase subunit PurQ [Neolewinella lacunae]